MMTRLTVRRGPDPGAVYELNTDVITLGRSPHNTIVINDDQVSRAHLRLVRVGPDYELHDLGSSNGTFVDGQRVAASWLLPPVCLIELGDSITLAYERALPSEADGARAVDDRSDQLFLVVNLGPDTERVYALESETITVGRDLSNDIVLPDPEVSRWHLQLKRQGGAYVVRDLGSTNGTLLNGVRLTAPRTLVPHDTLDLGTTTVRLHYVRNPKDAQQGARAAAAAPRPEAAAKLDTKEVKQADLLNLAGKRRTSRLGTGLQQGALDQHIMVAYAREDWEEVIAPLTIALQDAGIDVWVDQYLTPGADDWAAAVEQALTECWLLVLVVSPAALESRHVRLEYRYFVNREKPLLLFIYQPVNRLPPELAGLESIAYDPANSMSSFRRLILEILHRRP
ncbi:MAG: FHA domain-containing protein [Aggregatilineales bacterium]